MTGTASTLDGESGLTFDGSTLFVTNTSADPSITITDTSVNDPYIRIVPSTSTNAFAIGIDDSDSDKFKISYGSSAVLGTNDRFVIDTSGNVGIGISPTVKLDVSGDYKFVHNPSTELSVAGAYGDIVTFGSGSGFTTGGLYYYATSGTWTLADASSVAASSGLLSIALGATPSSGMLLRGYAKYTGTSYTSMTLGGIQYISGTAGSFTQTAPSITGDVVRIIGYSIDAANDILYFNPSNDWIEI
jgi:hypothetical protein